MEDCYGEKMKEKKSLGHSPASRESVEPGDIFSASYDTKTFNENQPAAEPQLASQFAYAYVQSSVIVPQDIYPEPPPPVTQRDKNDSKKKRRKNNNTDKAFRKYKRLVRLMCLMKVVTFVLTVLFMLAGLVVGGLMIKDKFKVPDISSADDTFTSNDGKLSISIHYDKEAFQFKKSNVAELQITLKNETPNLLRDVSFSFDLPDGLELPDQKNVVRADFLVPNGKHMFSIPVVKTDVLEDNFVKIVFVFSITVLFVTVLLVAYAVCAKKYKHLAQRITAAILSVFILAPIFGNVVFAANAEISGAELVIDEDRNLPSGIKSYVTSEGSVTIGSGANSNFTYRTEYSIEERLMLEVKSRESGYKVDITWNTIMGAQEYCLYQAGEDKNFVEISTTNVNRSVAEIYPGNVYYFRVMAKTEYGDVYSNDTLILLNDEGRVFADSDGDLLPDNLEIEFGTSPLLADTDGDGLSDYDEIVRTMTDPLAYDSDGNGISDGDEDPDGDGLSNLLEIKYGTNPLLADTDGDGLTDGFEINEFFSDPLKYDTDGDGLSDMYEYLFGTDPNKADTDGDGIIDSQATYTSDVECEDNDSIYLSLTDVGDSLTVAQVIDITEDTVFADKEYIASPIVSVEVAETTSGTITLPLLKKPSSQLGVAETTSGTVTLSLLKKSSSQAEVTEAKSETNTPSLLKKPSSEDIAIAVYDLDRNGFRVLEGSKVSEDGSKISAPLSEDIYRGSKKKTDQGSEVLTRRTFYVAFYVPNWHAEFSAPLSPSRDEGSKAHFDVAFVIDESGSMEDSSKGSAPNDPDRLRVVAAKNFTRGLIKGDRASVVGFSDNARRKNYLTEDMEEVRDAIDSISGTAGGTALYNGLQEAIEELIESLNETRGRFIIALTDGEDNYLAEETYDNIIAQCVKHHIPIYTIGLGSSVNTALLVKLATQTEGSYFYIRSAADIPLVFNRIENTAFFGEDTDGDGLADKIEEYGMRDGVGNIYKTDPLDRFTDGDDLDDGEEAGNVMYSKVDDEDNTIAYYIMLTDPTKADTDGDGLDDLDELMMGTLPWCRDTDGDGLSDGLEVSIGYDPLDANPDGDTFPDREEYLKNLRRDFVSEFLVKDKTSSAAALLIRGILAATARHDPFGYDLNFAEKSVAFIQGLVLGDFGDILAELGAIDKKLAGSFFYTLGSIISNLLPGHAGIIATIRDIFANLIEGDLISAFSSTLSIAVATSKVEKAMIKICEWLAKAYIGDTYFNELSEKKSVSQLVAMPAFSIYILKIMTIIQTKFGFDMDYDNLMSLLSEQINKGVKGLEKENIRNWEAILVNAELIPYRVSDSIQESKTVVLDVPYKSTPITLADSVRKALNTRGGGTLTADYADGNGLYTLTRTFDLECTAYQNEYYLKRALEDAVNRVASYADKSYPSLHKKLQIAISDAIISKEVRSVFQNIQDYADEKGVKIEYCLYLTSDDRDPRTDLSGVKPSDKKEAIIILPGITGSELIAAENWGVGISAVKEGDIIWLPERLTELLEIKEQIIQQFSQQDFSDTTNSEKPSISIFDTLIALVPDVVEALERLKLDSSGLAPFKIRAKQVEPQDSYVGTFDSATKLYKTCLEKYGETRDVVFYGYDWRKSVAETATQLKMYIDSREYEKVTFVCHSMGGVVASYYLAENENDLEKVGRVITLGTPFGGSPKALLTLEEGKFLEMKIPILNTLLYATLKELSRNYPSVYELLPYNLLIDNGGNYIMEISPDNTCMLMDKEWTEHYISDKGNELNQRMFRDALETQRKIYRSGEHILNNEKIDAHIIAGYGRETLMMIETSGGSITGTQRNDRGDGTVPLISATQTNGQFFNKPIYLVDGVKHGDMLKDDNLIDLVCQIIDNGRDVTPKGEDIKLRADTENTIEEAIYAALQARRSTNKVTAFCPVALVLVNEKDEILGLISSLGILADEEYEDCFELLNGGETKQIQVPPGCSVKVLGESEGKMDLMMSTFNPDGDLLKRSYFKDIDVSDKMLANIAMKDAANVTIEIDSDADDTYDKILTEKDGEVFVKSGVAGKSKIKTELLIVIGFVILIVLGTVLSLLAISKKYSTKRREPIKNRV